MAARLVLASASPRRRDLLAALGLPFEVAATDIDERAIAAELAGLPAEEHALRIAIAKAMAAPPDGNTVVLAADTVVAIDGRILGKPDTEAEADAMLRFLRGRKHTVASAIAVRHDTQIATDVSIARVTMRAYTDNEIARYIATGGPMDKAGSYAIQDPVFAPVARREGCYCGIMGLPLWRTAALLAAAGVPARPPSLPQCATCPAR